MAKRETWTPVTRPEAKGNILDVLNSLLIDCDHGAEDEMTESLVIDPRGGRQAVEYRTDKNRFRVILHPNAPPVEILPRGQRAVHREINIGEVVAIEHQRVEAVA